MKIRGVWTKPVPEAHHDDGVESSGVLDVHQLEKVDVTWPAMLPANRSGASVDSADDLSSRSWLQRLSSSRLRPVAGALALGLGLVVASWRVMAGSEPAATLEQSLVSQLAVRGLDADPDNIVWIDSEPNWVGMRSALFIAKRPGELHDVYYANARVSERNVRELYSLTNTTRTSSADEAVIAGSRGVAAYASRVGDAYRALVVVDPRGEPAELTAGWPWYAKAQNAITNLQDTGRLRAFGLRRYHFQTPVSHLGLAIDSGLIEAVADGDKVVLHPRRPVPVVGAERVDMELPQKGQPGLITWVVDTVRRIPGVGRAPVEWLEHKVFGLSDRISRTYHEFVETDTAAEAEQALAVAALPSTARALPTEDPSPASAHASQRQASGTVADVAQVDEDLGWPPAPIPALLPDNVRGEGVWLPVADDDGFVTTQARGPSLFYQTFVRVDPERTYTRVYITLWDPRQVRLGIVMGTKEPESATGETANGMIPRDPFVLSHLVGAFNGGFQAMHGEFGMMADKRVYLPPKPFAATVAVFEDGTAGMGSWPGPGRHAWDESFATSQIPEGVLAMRQNLTSVVEGDVYNPWERWWWGAAPEWAEEQTYIHRSGLCLTREGFFAYFWGESMGPQELGKAMLAARCARGMHLDMNSKHTGFEFYRPYAHGRDLPALTRALRPAEFEGEAAYDPTATRFRGRLAVTTMSPIRVPRYLGQDPRDFFYLTRKPTLPGSELTQDGRHVAFSTRGLPTPGFPHAFARAEVAELGWIARIDLARAVPEPLAHPSLTRVLGQLHLDPESQGEGGGAAALFARFEHGRLRAQIGRAPAGSGSRILLAGPLLAERPGAMAGLGVDDEGFLVYAQGSRQGAVERLLALAGVRDALALPEGGLMFEADDGSRSVDGEELGETGTSGQPGQRPPASEQSTSLRLLAEMRPAAQVLFEDVQPRPYRKWAGLQDQRVRYFPSHPARFQAPDSAR